MDPVMWRVVGNDDGPQQGMLPVELQAGRTHDSATFVDDEEPLEVLRHALDRELGSRK